jgi:hypothetical protein
MPLVHVDLPSPSSMRGGWAALAAVYAARGWGRDVWATSDEWFYHDGGGNWASLRLVEHDKVLLIGHDHEYSETYFGKAAEYFGEEETDLLSGAPDWWAGRLDLPPVAEWIGFIYGWDGKTWQRAQYGKPDGFAEVGLLSACSLTDMQMLEELAKNAPGLHGMPASDALRVLVSANAGITDELLAKAVPGWNIEAGVAAARRFLEMRL